MPTVFDRWFSDHDMQCPGSYYGGFKEARYEDVGTAERRLSERTRGDWIGATMTRRYSDWDLFFRRALASGDMRYWVDPVPVWIQSREGRANLFNAFMVFNGVMLHGRPVKPLSFEITWGDVVAQGILSDDVPIPYRQSIKDGFFSELVLSDRLDLETPDPIIYGEHRRIPDQDPASEEGFQYTPIYIGDDGVERIWMVCGHACDDIPDVLVWTEGVYTTALTNSAWLVPHHGGTPLYEDRTHNGITRRFTLIRGVKGNPDVDACASGEKTLTVFVKGVEDIGNGLGTLLADRFDQYQHFLINFVANSRDESYQSGNWLTNPTWDLYDETVSVVDTASFAAGSVVGQFRLPPNGYVGAAIIGRDAGDRRSVRQYISDWNRSCGCRFGVTRKGRLMITMCHPTSAAKVAAGLYTDVNDILKGSFDTDLLSDDHANSIPFRADYEHQTGQWRTNDTQTDALSVLHYGREIKGEIREYPFAPGITMTNHLALMELRQMLHPPRRVVLEGSIVPRLARLELGDYIKYRHFAAIGSAFEDRLAQVESISISPGKRTVKIEAIDVEELIGFDGPDVGDSDAPTAPPPYVPVPPTGPPDNGPSDGPGTGY